MAVRQDVLIFWKPGNFMAEMQGRHALKHLCEKEVCHFHEFHTPGVLVGLSFSVNLKKNCRINFQCRCKNVIMVVYGKSDCGPCPSVLFTLS